jgi:hypothetical protein
MAKIVETGVKSKSREGKKYQLRSSAARAAKEDGIESDNFFVLESASRGGGFYYLKKDHKINDLTNDQADDVKKQIVETPKVQEKLMEVMTSAQDLEAPRTAEQVRTIVENATPTTQQLDAAYQAAGYTIGEARQAPAVVTKPAAPSIPKIERLHKSTIESPTKTVWAVADQMLAANPNVTRKMVMAQCVSMGIAYWTARTQYQQWITAKRESDRNAAEANGKHKK